MPAIGQTIYGYSVSSVYLNILWSSTLLLSNVFANFCLSRLAGKQMFLQRYQVTMRHVRIS